jgi:DNA-binding NarL/FixJ family response regulator
MSATIILIDEHPGFRREIAGFLQQFEDFRVVGEADDGREGEILAQRYKPDIAIIGLSLPDVSGIHLTGILLTQLPAMRIVIISRHQKIDYVIGALNAGALGYIVKDSAAKSLGDCLLAALAGTHYIDPVLSRHIAERLINNPATPYAADSAFGSLTPREREILELLAKGLVVREIGEKLFVSPKTVANHRANIMAKLDIHSTAQLVRLTVQQSVFGRNK